MKNVSRFLALILNFRNFAASQQLHYKPKQRFDMKRILFIVAGFLAFSGTIKAQSNTSSDEYSLYFEADDLPNAVVWLPAPPDTTSTQFVYDITQYMWGKRQRLDEDRAQQAIDNAVENVDEMAEQFSVPFGMEITKEKTPAIFKVLYRGVLTIRLSANKPKDTYMRKRPYTRFNEHTLVPEEEERLRLNGSYPSGHTVRGWSMALLLCEINPEAQDALLTLGYEWGQSRVIAGYHWQSDVNASRLLAAAGYARLHTNAEFLADIAAAREEFARLKADAVEAPQAASHNPAPSAAIYNLKGEQLNGKPVTGPYIENGKKRISK